MIGKSFRKRDQCKKSAYVEKEEVWERISFI
jgi:hypothetical protein